MEKRSRMAERSRKGRAISAKSRRKYWWKKHRLTGSILCAGIAVLIAFVVLTIFLPFKAALFLAISLLGFVAAFLLWLLGDKWQGGLKKAAYMAVMCIGFAFLYAGLESIPGFYEGLGLEPIQLKGQVIEQTDAFPQVDVLLSESTGETVIRNVGNPGALTLFRSRAATTGNRFGKTFGGIFLKTVDYQRDLQLYQAGRATAAEGEEVFFAEASSSVPVWVSSGNGTRYHLKPDCGGMHNPLVLTLEEAVWQGYTPCGRCYK